MIGARAGKRGRLFVISAPSGSGKTTLLNRLVRKEPRLFRSISATTRCRRRGERNKRDYQFLSRQQFERARRQGMFLESARILGHWYGTPRIPIERALRAGRNVLLGIDIQGAAQIRRSRIPAATIFLLPPSLEILSRRLRHRGTETPAQIQARLRLARRELAQLKQFDYAVVNHRIEEAVSQVQAILKAEPCRLNHKR